MYCSLSDHSTDEIEVSVSVEKIERDPSKKYFSYFLGRDVNRQRSILNKCNPEHLPQKEGVHAAGASSDTEGKG